MIKNILLIFLSTCILLTGCTYTNSIQLNCVIGKPVKKIHQIKSKPKVFINVIDKRNVDNPKSFVTMVAANKMIDVAEKPIANIIYNAISIGLQQMNITVSSLSDSRYVFNCEINEINGGGRASGVASGLSTIKIYVHCYLIDKSNGRIIWQDRLTAEGQSIVVWCSNVKNRKNAFCEAIKNMIAELQGLEPLYLAFL